MKDMEKDRFKVVIYEVLLERKPAGNEWKPTGEDNPKYAYTPEIMIKDWVTREIYQQTVSDLDVKAVIKAVNSLEDS